MAPIENIGNNLPPVDGAKQRNRVASSRSENIKQQGQAGNVASSGLRGDTVDISSAGRQLSESQNEVARFQDLLDGLRNVDSGKLSVIRQRIDAGEFDQPEVLDQVAQTINRLPQFRPLSEAPTLVPPELELAGSVQERIRSGQFQSDEVLQQVAVNILNEIGVS